MKATKASCCNELAAEPYTFCDKNEAASQTINNEITKGSLYIFLFTAKVYQPDSHV